MVAESNGVSIIDCDALVPELMFVHELISWDVISWTGLANLGQVDQARELFNRMPERDIISWTVMIDGYMKANHFKEVLEIFREMQDVSVRPDEFTMVSVLTAWANLGYQKSP
ncbi:hypothetical protein IEQ34_017244 [Dendrobium chrysotoxum]|uniref:Pentatricopeptide repeat-containing protein n=1 Tax=Dendrobium chrysotoxum TaxID=161865 RepID=A0AAV7G9R2_DENCH|nr:hypothetical protein IEQ34_017244 [Dendrobium chrysotoxum]